MHRGRQTMAVQVTILSPLQRTGLVPDREDRWKGERDDVSQAYRDRSNWRILA